VSKRGKRPALPPTQYLYPPLVLDNEEKVLAQRRAFGRKLGAESRQRFAQLDDEVVAAIVECCRRNPDASNSEVANWVSDHPKTQPLVEHLKHGTLRKKVAQVRPPRK
jgi:hypothetical protein